MTMQSELTPAGPNGAKGGRAGGIKTTAAQAVVTGKDRLREASGLARELADTGRERTIDAARLGVAQARRKPVSTGLLVAGAVLGGAALLNPALRRVAIGAAPAVWKMIRNRQNAALGAAAVTPASR